MASRVESERRSPEEWLEASQPTKEGGRFKIFLGYAPGVGKTFSMLSEGIRRRSRECWVKSLRQATIAPSELLALRHNNATVIRLDLLV